MTLKRSMAAAPPRVCLVQQSMGAVSETFLQAHAQRLPGVVAVIHRMQMLPAVDGRIVLSQQIVARMGRKLLRTLRRETWHGEIHRGYAAAFRRFGAEVVIVEYGTLAPDALPACHQLGIPLVVYFRGYDASRHDVIEKYRDDYRRVFEHAFAIVAVARSIATRLIDLGCPADKIVVNPSGVDAEAFQGAAPELAEPRFLAVGRMVQKKGVHLTLAAFARVLQECSEARLRIIGDGGLRGIFDDLSKGLEIDHAVTFLGSQAHQVVCQEMRNARAVVLHSLVATSGDSEGTPNVILEAAAMGLPVVATRHAGIPDVVIEGETGLLVDERDVAGMAHQMLALARSPRLAGQLGRQAAAHVRKYYTMDHSIARLSRVLQAAADGEDIARVRAEIDAELPPATSDTRVARDVTSSLRP